jgi:UPF0716 protein FxsA
MAVLISEPRGHTGYVAPLLFFVFIVVPIVELYVILQVAGAIGVLETVGLLILVSVLGTWLMKQQGMAAWSRLRRTLDQGRIPNDEITDGAMIMFGGALLLTPGFVTDALGLVLLFPPTRAGVKRLAARSMKRWARKRSGGRGIYEARVVKVERDPTTAPSASSPAGPSGAAPAALEDDSPDRG